MDTIETNMQLLIWSIKRSWEYRQYKKCEMILEREPELMKRVDEFRRHNYELQNSLPKEDMFQAMDRLSHESEELHKIPKVHDYLQAELSICRLLQNITLEIDSSLDIRIPIQLGETQ